MLRDLFPNAEFEQKSALTTVVEGLGEYVRLQFSTSAVQEPVIEESTTTLMPSESTDMTIESTQLTLEDYTGLAATPGEAALGREVSQGLDAGVELLFEPVQMTIDGSGVSEEPSQARFVDEAEAGPARSAHVGLLGRLKRLLGRD